MTRICSVPDCGRKHLAKGFCNLHYRRYRKHGSLELHRRVYHQTKIERNAAVVAMFDSGLKAIEIARMCGLSRERIRVILKSAGSPTHHYPTTGGCNG